LKTNATNTGNQASTDGANGFGVFAYYTGKETYSKAQYGYDTSVKYQLKPNFMYNQRVYWDEAAPTGYITNWTYSPIKYWPNEVQNGDVDDQDGNTSNDPAQGSDSYGGNVSFFAYAPYVFVNTTGANPGEPTSGQANYNTGNLVVSRPLQLIM